MRIQLCRRDLKAPMIKTVRFVLNGKDRVIVVQPDMRLTEILRDTCALTGGKFGCSVGRCGSYMCWWMARH